MKLVGSESLFATIQEDTYSTFFATLNERTPVKQDARDFLRQLCDLEIPFAIVTNTKTGHARERIENSDIGELVGEVFGADLVSRGKPDPSLYLHAAEMLGVTPGACLAIEDSTAGVTAALGAGCDVAHIPDMTPIAEELSSRCKHFTTSLTRLSVELGHSGV